MCYAIGGKGQVLFCIPLIQNALSIVFFTITFQAH